MARKHIPDDIQTKVLLQSGRRCCLCFGLDNISEEKRGQIAHIDRNSANNEFDNLVFLCLKCHDEYDSRNSQSKRFTVKEIKFYRKKLYKYIASRQQDDGKTTKIVNFTQLAIEIGRLLDKNKKAFMSFGPNSNADSAGNVRWDLRLWKQAKREIILPNNQTIQKLIEQYGELIPAEHKTIFDQMSSHIYAFEKHCKDPSLDYRDYQFPKEFSLVIDAACMQNQEQKATLHKIKT